MLQERRKSPLKINKKVENLSKEREKQREPTESSALKHSAVDSALNGLTDSWSPQGNAARGKGMKTPPNGNHRANLFSLVLYAHAFQP